MLMTVKEKITSGKRIFSMLSIWSVNHFVEELCLFYADVINFGQIGHKLRESRP